MLPLRISTQCSRAAFRNSLGCSRIKRPPTSINHSPILSRCLRTNRHIVSKPELYTSNSESSRLSKSIISYIPKRVFTSKPTEKAATETAIAKAKQLKDAASNVKDRNATDWAIIKQLMKYIWPKNDIGVKTRVVIALSLLIGGKVSIQIETMSIDIDYSHVSS